MSAPSVDQPMVLAVPEVGQLVLCRDRHWIVSEVAPDQVGAVEPTGSPPAEHLVTMSSVEDDGLGESLSVVWEIEPGATALGTATLPTPVAGQFDPPEEQAAFLDAIRWGAVTSADAQALQAPFRAGISIEDYQLDPVVRALEMPRVNLGIFDDVGLGKTIEAGLVVQELLLRHRARSVWVVCPPNLCLKWQEEMQEKFGLEFRIVDSSLIRQLRRERGLASNAFTHFPRLIISLDWIKRPAAQRLLNQVLPAEPEYPRPFDILIVDEVHQCAPSGVGKYATDSQRTKAIRRLAEHFEHRLFLSATPHNGYRESFTALLELLDPQKFARGVEPNEHELRRSVIRRLKSTMRKDPELALNPDGSQRFTERILTDLEVQYPESERKAHNLLTEYTHARQERLTGKRKEGKSLDFVTIMLKKRLFSSPEAFARTLAVHQETIRNHTSHVDLTDRAFRSTLTRTFEEDFADDTEADAAAEDALAASAKVIGKPTQRESQLLIELQAWADDASGRPDAKTEVLLNKINEWLRTGHKWKSERLIIFTEYRDTQNWLYRLMIERGIPEDRIDLLYGGMDPEARENVKRNFQADPESEPIRILIATDAASEGIDLQRHCRRMVHMEIPWNPNRMEQRNGRIDRHLQPFPQVFINHFVSANYDSTKASALEADLQFLALVARKVEQIRDDLGSVGQVLSDQVSDAMLGRRRNIDESALTTDRSQKAKRQLAKLERDLRERFRALHERLLESQTELRLTPGSIARAVNVGLALGRQSPLIPVEIKAKDRHPSVRGYRVPQLTRSWAGASANLHDPKLGYRPITFDNAAAGRDDVVLEHLGSRLVSQSLRLLRAQIWSSRDESRLSRVSTRIVSDSDVPGLTLLAHARIVITGGDGRRLHEEVIYAGGEVRSGRFARIDTLKRLRELLETESVGDPSRSIEEEIEALWPKTHQALYDALDARASTRFDSLAKRLESVAEDEKAKIAELLTELQTSISSELDVTAPGIEQLALEFAEPERDQLHADLDALRARIDRIPAEIAAEQEQIDARFADQHTLMFPAAVTILVPQRLAETIRGST